MPRLDDRVPFERGAVLHARRHVREPRQQVDLHRLSPGRQAEFPQLAGVPGGADQPDQIRTARFCTSISSAMPPRAKAIRLAIWDSSKGVCSAVACTSTNFPAPVITTFISTSA